jgi:hypothetical protein
MGPETTNFTMRINPTASALAILALKSEAPEETDLLELVVAATGKLNIKGGQAALLASALFDYADGQLREGSDDYRDAYDFAHALGDVAVTADALDAAAARELREQAMARPPEDRAARADRAFRERMDRKRDEMLREVFTGGPRYKLNIWTGKTEEVGDPEAEHRWRRKMAKSVSFGWPARTPVYLDPEVKPPPSRTRVTHLRGVVPDAEALSRQQAADAADALGPITDHNAQMKVEGAEQLILDKNRGITHTRSHALNLTVGTETGTSGK